MDMPPYVIAVFFALPLMASAATGAPTDFKGLALLIVGIINTITGVAVSIGVIYYLWNVAVSINDASSAKSWENFRKQILWGILALFVMFSIWGILRILDNTLFTGVPPT